MVFNSLGFILFFAVVLLVHHLPLPWTARKVNLLVASYVFYAAWSPAFLLLLLFSTLFNFYLGRVIDAADARKARKLRLVAALVVNLGLLAFFKYTNFFLSNFTFLLNTFGLGVRPASFSIALPLGISFYTFQTLSYLLDIYYKQIKPTSSPLDFGLYVAFFPKVIAGPIVRAKEFLPQCEAPRRATRAELSWGLTLVLVGLFEKTVVADNVFAPIANLVYSSPARPDLVSAWCGTLAVAGQIFYDFAGYSTCALGVALCLGFKLPENFYYPYAAVGFADFWRRWHITLSTWLRDYLFFSLGGIRKGAGRIYLNLFITMLLAGLWHGPTWAFVVWGGLHGLLLVGERVLQRRAPGKKVWRKPPVQFALALGTFVMVSLTWVFFNARELGRALDIVAGMFGLRHGARVVYTAVVLNTLVAVAVMLALHWLMRNSSLERVARRTPWWLRSAAMALMLVLIVLAQGEDRAFIYFQF
jgi:alginate O-acetyltransferase complex protein AlgI